ncbi:MAG: hypothetical protein Q7S06_02815 [Nanoarchaeota archaeon]|nr:hypothetical protein [Nanoarchaeota archaeon]
MKETHRIIHRGVLANILVENRSKTHTCRNSNGDLHTYNTILSHPDANYVTITKMNLEKCRESGSPYDSEGSIVFWGYIPDDYVGRGILLVEDFEVREDIRNTKRIEKVAQQLVTDGKPLLATSVISKRVYPK